MASPVYDAIREHQSLEDVPYHEIRTVLNRVSDRMILDFKLRIESFVIGIEKLPVRVLGRYRRGVNALGLRSEIHIAEHHILECLGSEKEYDILGTLAHELLHCWQEVHGKPAVPPYHNKAFRERCASIGLLVDQHGHQEYDPGSPFFALLEREGISFPVIQEPRRFVRPKKKGKSTLKLWICSGCHKPQRARVGAQKFEAACLRCNTPFVLHDP